MFVLVRTPVVNSSSKIQENNDTKSDIITSKTMSAEKRAIIADSKSFFR